MFPWNYCVRCIRYSDLVKGSDVCTSCVFLYMYNNDKVPENYKERGKLDE